MPAANGSDDATTAQVRAEFDDVQNARHAIEILGRSGVDGTNIKVEKNPVAAETEPTIAGQASADDKLVRKTVSGAGRGICCGAVAGGILGLVVGLILFGARGPTVGVIVAGAIVFGLLGLVLGGYTAVDVSPAWESTIQPGDGPATLSVHYQTPADKELVTSTLVNAGGRVL